MESIQIGDLPAPPAQLAAHSEQVLAHILAEIRSCGPISFERYMEQVLYAPGLGYYSAGLAKFGADGDFITAPTSGNLFARCLARQAAQVHAELGGLDAILEVGAGTGVMAAQLLLSLAELDSLPRQYWILERSADLRGRQAQHLGALPQELSDLVLWLDAPPEEPFEGIVVANEVLDALPVRRWTMTDEGLKELLVGEAGGRLRWERGEPGSALASAFATLAKRLRWPVEVGYESELLLHPGAWLKSFSGALSRGLVLLVDYGYSESEYYHPQRAQGTLICHYRHRGHSNPFFLPGGQDISAFVDFSNVAWSASDCGLDVAGFATQAHFLLALGITDLVGPDSLEDVQQVKRLTLPTEMGEKFKAMALLRDMDVPLLGFSLENRLDRL